MYTSSCLFVIFVLSSQVTGYYFGVLQSDLQYNKSDYSAGVRLATIEIGWDAYEPAEGLFNTNYINSIKSKISQWKAAGYQLVLDCGMQYPPNWIFNVSYWQYKNQFGLTMYKQPGKPALNFVFNQMLRAKQQTYVQRIFQDLGTSWFSVRLGWQDYSELGYPNPNFTPQGSTTTYTNCYWAFDDIAMGVAPASYRPSGITVNPVPSWKPGAPSTNHTSARVFLNWYMNSLKNYHDWQIKTTRLYHSGRINMLYPSVGLRTGQFDAAVNGDLNGQTSPEINQEVQRGYDFARYIAGIKDAKVSPYTTWLDASWPNDASPYDADWSQAHWFHVLSQQNSLKLIVWGENTGQNDYAALQRCFNRMATYGLLGMSWAFESQLHCNCSGYATIQQYGQLISQYH